MSSAPLRKLVQRWLKIFFDLIGRAYEKERLKPFSSFRVFRVIRGSFFCSTGKTIHEIHEKHEKNLTLAITDLWAAQLYPVRLELVSAPPV